MLESLAAWVLNAYIGEYLENLNTEQLSIGLLQGQIELENVPIKTTALKKFDLPFAVKSGVLGKLTLQIPITHLRSEPWIISIADLYVVLEPSFHRYDVEIDEGFQLTKKLQQLEALAAYHKKKLSQSDTPNDNPNTWTAYGASLISTIVDNIQLNIKNVHVRYEDETSIPNSSFCFGVKIDTFSIQSTTSNWETGSFVTRNDGDNIFKVLEIENLCFYWNADTPTDIVDVAAEDQYVVKPISGKIKFARNCSNVPLRQQPAIPRIKAELKLKDINVCLSGKQLKDQHALSQEWARFDRSRSYRKWRPRNPVIGHAREWWKFVIICHSDGIRSRNEQKTWKFVLQRARNNVAYYNAYRLMLIMKGFSKKDEILMKQIEQEYSYDLLVVLREYAMKRLLKERGISDSFQTKSNASDVQQQGYLTSWWSYWYGSSPAGADLSKNDAVDSESRLAVVSSPSNDSDGLIFGLPEDVRQGLLKIEEDLENEIRDVILESVDDHTYLRRDNLFADFLVEVEQMSLVFSDEKHSILHMRLYDAKFSLLLSPRFHSLKVDGCVTDLKAKSDFMRATSFPNLLWRPYEARKSTQFLRIQYERQAPNLTAFHKIYVNMEPAYVMYDHAAYLAVRDFFDKSFAVDKVGYEKWVEDENQQANIRDKFTEILKSERRHVQESLKELDIYLNISSPKLFIPEFGEESKHLVILDFGSLIFRTDESKDSFKPIMSNSFPTQTLNGFTNEDGDEFITPPSTPTFSGDETSMFKDGADTISGNYRKVVAFHLGDVTISNSDALASVAPNNARLVSSHLLTVHDVYAVEYDYRGSSGLTSPDIFQYSCGGDLGEKCAKSVLLHKTSFDVLISQCKLDETEDQNQLSQYICMDIRNKQDVITALQRWHIDLLLNLFQNLKGPEKENTVSETGMKVGLNIPNAQLEFLCDIAGEEKGFALAKTEGLTVIYRKEDVYSSELNISMTSLIVEDKLETSSLRGNSLLICSSAATTSFTEYLSSSCPDIPEEDDNSDMYLSTSLPDALTIKSRLSMTAPSFVPGSRSLKCAASCSPCINVTVKMNDAPHPGMEAKFQKNETAIDVDLGTVDLAFNRDTCVFMFVYLFGDSGSSLNQRFDEGIGMQNPDQPVSSQIHCNISQLRMYLRSAQNTIRDSYPFSRLFFDSVRCEIDVQEDQMFFNGSCEGLYIKDETPKISDLYPEKLVLRSNARDIPSLRLKFHKHRKPDPRMLLPYDVSVDITPCERIIYVHSQRFISEMISFWMNFAQMYEYAEQQQKRVISGSGANVLPFQKDTNFGPSRGSRVKLQLDALLPILVIPLSSYSCQAIISEIKRLTIDNLFAFHSQMLVSGGDMGNGYDEHDCLLDILNLQVSGLQIFPAVKSDHPSAAAVALFEYGFEKLKTGLLSKPTDICITVTRNLDGAISHNVPDMNILAVLNGANVTCTLDEYRLVRGFLEHNLGDEIPSFDVPGPLLRADPSTVSVLSGRTWCGLRFALDMTSVKLLCIQMTQLTSMRMETIALLELTKAKLTFESYSNGSRNLILSGQDLCMRDSRYDEAAVNKRPNAFPVILARKSSAKNLMSNLLVEVHLHMDGPVNKLNIVLSDTEIIFVPDWSWSALTFLLTDPFPKVSETKAISGSVTTPRPGVVTKMNEPVPAMPTTKLDLRLNLVDSDVFIVERLDVLGSEALMLHMTAVFTLKQVGSSLERLSCSVQSIAIDSCIIAQAEQTAINLAPPFSCSLEIGVEDIKGNPLGLQELSAVFIRHFAELSITDISIGLAYKDYLLVNSIIKKYTVDGGSAPDKSRTELMELKPQYLNVKHILIKLESFSLRLINDLNLVNSYPVARVRLTEAKIDQNETEGFAEARLQIDYYNRDLSAWEPFLEPWEFNSHWLYMLTSNSLVLDALSNSVLNMNLTVPCIQQARLLYNSWFNLPANYGEESDYSLPRHDYVPYVLINDTGSKLSFSFESKRNDNQMNRKRNVSKWVTVAPAEEKPFSFENLSELHVQSFGNDRYMPHEIIIKVDGWHETSPVAVDRVGTFFRLAKTQAQSSGLPTSDGISHCRIVIAVKLDEQSRKLVRIRSGLQLVNCLVDDLQVRLHSDVTVGERADLTVASKSVVSIPLKFVHSKFSVRPVGLWSVEFSKHLINWTGVTKPGQQQRDILECGSPNSTVPSYHLFVNVKREYYPEHQTNASLPAHTISFVPPLLLQNLLPVELNFKMVVTATNLILTDRISSLKTLPLCAASSLGPIEVELQTELSRIIRPFTIQNSEQIFDGLMQLRLQDPRQRHLILQYRFSQVKGGGLKVTISAPYWIINKTGLPLVIKQHAASKEAAGQFDEHEAARSMVPLLFSFADPNCPEQCQIRIGRRLHPSCEPAWCRHFVLQPGTTSRSLICTPRGSDGSGGHIYNIGVEVRVGQGIFKDTNFVILTPSYQIENRSSFKLLIAQKHDIEVGNSSVQCCLSAGCCMAFHWPHQDREALLCVKRDDLQHWSQGFRIDGLAAFHLNIRDDNGIPQFIRVEVVLHGAMHYVTFSNADDLPPPIRLENQSLVPVLYKQAGVYSPRLQQMLKPNSYVNYSWDDNLAKPDIVLTVFESQSKTYDLTILSQAEPLTYENYFYIAFAATFNPSSTNCDHELVLDTLMPSKAIVLKKKDPNVASQLWRLSADGCLENFGIGRLVLDVQSSTADPYNFVPLMLQQMDQRRRLTQRWEFTPDQRLVCGLKGLYVQVGSNQLRVGQRILLGPPLKAASINIPSEQWIEKQRSRPGSGMLCVQITNDGPTRVLQIYDRGTKPTSQFVRKPTEDLQQYQQSFDVSLSLTLVSGFGISIINQFQEELLYCSFKEAVINFSKRSNGNYGLGVQIMEIQANNQISSDNWQLLYIRPKLTEDDKLAGFILQVQWFHGRTYDAYDKFFVNIGKASLQLDELLLWKLVQFAEFDAKNMLDQASQLNIEPEKPPDTGARRCYVGIMNIQLYRLYLSVITANVLPAELRPLRQAYNMRLVRFENAPVQLSPFIVAQYFGTTDFLWDSFRTFYAAQLKGQAMRILGTVDFLGNPLGLFNDVAGGISELLTEGSVGGFVAGLAHGVTNSAAKFTSSLSEGVGKITMDEQHQELRESMRLVRYRGDAIGHVVSGFKGLGIGILGGTTSIISQSYQGAKSGFGSAVIGLGKGLVGTVTKPVQGILDFTSGIANAAKEVVSSTGPPKTRFPEKRIRPPRVATSLNGTIPVYDHELAMAQQYSLSRLSSGESKEMCLAVECVFHVASSGEYFRSLVTNESVYITKQGIDEIRCLLKIPYGKLTECTVSQDKDGVINLEILWKQGGLHSENQRSKVRCGDRTVADRISRQVMCAKSYYDDMKRSLVIPEDTAVEL